MCVCVYACVDVYKRVRVTHFLVNGVRECFSYRQCLRYLTQRLHVGMALLHFDFRRRHSLQAWSAKPRGVSRSPNPAPRLKDKSDEVKSPPLPSEKVVSADGELPSMVIWGMRNLGFVSEFVRATGRDED